MPAIPVSRSKIRLLPDPKRLITKSYVPADNDPAATHTRALRLIERALAMPPNEVTETLAGLREGFGARHADLDAVFIRGFSDRPYFKGPFGGSALNSLVPEIGRIVRMISLPLLIISGVIMPFRA